MNRASSAFAIWITAFAAVFSLYAHTVLNQPASRVTPAIAIVIAVGLGAATMPGADRSTPTRSAGGLRRASFVCLALALAAMVVSTLAAASTRSLSAKDWAVFALQVGAPVLLSLNPRRLELIVAIGVICVAFAMIDAAANLLAVGRVVELAVYSGRLGVDGVRLRYPGLSGNTHAAGLVAMVAIVSLGARLRRAAPPRSMLYAVAIAVLFGSMILIDARRYTALAALGLVVILYKPARRVPAALIATLVAGAAVWAIFRNIFDPADDLRARLMLEGLARAAEHPILGRGPAYLDPSAFQPGFQALATEGVTESGVLDLAVAYGVPAVTLLIAACMLALSTRRRAQSTPLVILTLLTAELAFGSPLTGFLGAVLFFACLLSLQLEPRV